MLIVTGGTGPDGDLASTEVDLMISRTMLVMMLLITMTILMMMLSIDCSLITMLMTITI